MGNVDNNPAAEHGFPTNGLTRRRVEFFEKITAMRFSNDIELGKVMLDRARKGLPLRVDGRFLRSLIPGRKRTNP